MLFVGLTYSVLPGISMIGHIVGLVVGTTIALLIPLNAGFSFNSAPVPPST